MNMILLKKSVLEERYSNALEELEVVEEQLTVASRNILTQVCREIAVEEGFGKAVELVIGLSRRLGFFIADPEMDLLETADVPMQTGTAVARLVFNPKRATRGDVKALASLGIIDHRATDESWMYEKWEMNRKGTGHPLNSAAYGWGKRQQDSMKCFLCSGLGEDRERPLNPNEVFLVCEGSDSPIYAGCNFAALAPYHMTAFRRERFQQAVDSSTAQRTLSILDNLQKGSDPGRGPFVVIHNGDLVCRMADDGKIKMVGAGATLMHDHNQFMRVDLPAAKAAIISHCNDGDVSASVLNWPSSMLRFDCPITARSSLLKCVNGLITTWQKDNQDNTVNLIVTRVDGDDVVFVALRRIGMADAQEKPCVASLEQVGDIAIDDRPMFENYQKATEEERRFFVSNVLASVDPVLKDVDGNVEQRCDRLNSYLARSVSGKYS